MTSRDALPSFARLWSNYPVGAAEDVKREIGGRVDRDWIVNTCAIRLSRSFNRAGHAIPGDLEALNTVVGGDGLRYAFRVRELTRHLNNMYGAPTVTHTYPEPEEEGAPGGGEVPEAFRGVRGVIVFDVDAWTDATGHLDLWDGEACVGHAYFDVARAVSLWPAAPAGEEAAPRLGGSVGHEGDNRPADVLIAQVLLSERGYYDGALDGESGPATIDAIRRFQAGFLRHPDGRIDVAGRTWAALERTEETLGSNAIV